MHHWPKQLQNETWLPLTCTNQCIFVPPKKLNSLHYQTLKFILTWAPSTLYSRCFSPHAGMIREPSWCQNQEISGLGSEEPEREKLGDSPATGHWHFSVCSLAEDCVCDWHSNGAHCLFTWVLTCVCVWVCAVEGPPSRWTVCNSKCSREGRTRTHTQTHKHTWRHTSLSLRIHSIHNYCNMV